MRLLSRENDRLLLTPDVPAQAPYAILSHTWQKLEDEVTYQDLLSGNVAKPGFDKIDFCLRQAARDGYTYVWVDTCCIDKRDSNELGKAINLMYDYYNQAQVCYVWLDDVEQDTTQITGCRWFTRGWTLQELVTPKDVLFYARGRLLGTRLELRDQIRKACGIDVDAPLSSISIAQRFKWSLKRQTKEPEDLYYSLVGLLELEKKLMYNYGEGAASARERLFTEIEAEHGRRVGKEIRQSFELAQLESQKREKNKLSVEQVLSSLSFPEMGARKALIKRPLESTCTWLISDSRFHDWWTMQGSRFLWIKGKPGTGKSTLVKYADCLSQDPNAIHISYYFNARGQGLEHCAEGMYRSLLTQLLNISGLTEHMLHFISSQTPTLHWTQDSLQQSVQQAVNILEQPIRCFIDALDEGSNKDVQEMIWFLQEIASDWLYICFASRHYPAVTNKHGVEMLLDEMHNDDIRKYIESRLDAEGDLLLELRNEILRKANGIFLWAVLVVNILNKELNDGTTYDLKRKLQELPPELVDLFEGIIFETSENDERFRLCLQWILFHQRSLTGELFYHAMVASMRPDAPLILASENRTAVPKHVRNLISSSSRGLAEEANDCVQIIHESVREYLLTQDCLKRLYPDVVGPIDFWVYNNLRIICQNYISKALSSETFVDKTLKQKRHLWFQVFEHEMESGEEIPYNHPFLDRAADTWLRLTERVAAIRSDGDLLDPLFDTRWTALYVGRIFYKYSRKHIRHVSIFNGFSKQSCPNDQWPYLFGITTQELSAMDEGLIIPGRIEWTLPLLVWHGSGSLLRQACQTESLITSSNAGQCLIFAISQRKFTISHLLIDVGADLEIRDPSGRTALLVALQECNSSTRSTRYNPCHSVATRLLLRGADIHACDSNGTSAECFAASAGLDNILTVMGMCGTSFSSIDACGHIPLIMAVSQNHRSSSKLLITFGADVDGQDIHGDTALLSATNSPDIELMELLTTHNANVNHANYAGETPLMNVVKACRILHVKHLLELGAEVNLQDVVGRTALLVAFQEGSIDIVKLLLEHGARPDILSQEGRSPLLEACNQPDHGSAIALTQLAFRYGGSVSINLSDYQGNLPLTLACLSSNIDLIDMLLEAGADSELVLTSVGAVCALWADDFDWDVEEHCRVLLESSTLRLKQRTLAL